jgi:acetylornithine/N-succinyldiaminopimelate aminotransferase
MHVKQQPAHLVTRTAKSALGEAQPPTPAPYLRQMIAIKELFLHNLAQTTRFPLALEMERAEGCYIYDTTGKAYLDLISGISVSNVGHRHPKVVAAIKQQVDKYMHLMVYGEYVQAPQVLLAKKIADLLPNPLESVYLVNSGAEAIDGALKLAKRFTGRPEIISFKNAYHGSSHGPLSVMGSETYKRAYRPLVPGGRLLDYNNFDQLAAIGPKTAAVLVEAVQSESGYLPGENGFLRAIQARCKAAGALLIVDEIQTGFGRTGKLFGFQHEGVVPDIVCFAKGLGGGMPIGAFVASKKVMDALVENPILGHITTFGGHPVSCAAALATIEVVLEEGHYKQAVAKEQLLRSLLVHPDIHAIQGRGLMLSVNLGSFDRVQRVIAHCLKAGVLTDWFLFNNHALRITPPLAVTEQELQHAAQVILDAIHHTSSTT